MKKTSVKKYNSEDEEIFGEINILSLGKMLNSNKNIKSEYWIGNFEKKDLEDFENFRYFENGDEFIKIGCFIEGKQLSNEMYFIMAGETGFSKAPFNFKEFFELMLKCKGYLGWQYNILFPDTDNAIGMEFYLNEIFETK